MEINKEEHQKEKHPEKEKKSWLSELFSLFLVVAIAMSIRTFVFELFYVPTGSMKGTILEGDYIFSTKYNYGYSIYSIPFNPDLFNGRIMASKPERGDVIIMRPPHNMDERYIKRLIGLPGETIEIIDDVIHINGEPIKRQYVGNYEDKDGIEYYKFEEILPNGVRYFSYKMIDIDSDDDEKFMRSNFEPYIIEEGKYFFIGDNRDNSGDSRYQLGTVPFRNFIAKGRFIIFSTGQHLWDSSLSFFEQIANIGTWFSSIRWSRIYSKLYFPDEEENTAEIIENK